MEEEEEAAAVVAAAVAPVAVPVEAVPEAEPMVLEEAQPVSDEHREAVRVPQSVAC